MSHNLFITLFLILLILINKSFANTNNYNKYYTECKVNGSTTIYDLKNDKWIITNQLDANKRTLPASTFKIIHSLIALNTNNATTNAIFKWDGTVREIKNWNADTNLETAFKNSTVWVYEKLADRIDKKTYIRYLNWLEYGNKKIYNGNNNNFWVYGEFGISPIEQVNMLIKLYKNELPFSLNTINKVKDFMALNNKEKLFGKSGWTIKGEQNIGWWIGYKIHHNKPIFFATRITKSTKEKLGSFIACRKSINNLIIKDYIKNNYK